MIRRPAEHSLNVSLEVLSFKARFLADIEIFLTIRSASALRSCSRCILCFFSARTFDNWACAQTQPTITLQHFQIVAALSLSLSLSLQEKERQRLDHKVTLWCRKRHQQVWSTADFFWSRIQPQLFLFHTRCVHKCMYSNTKLIIHVGSAGPFLLLHK